MSYFYCKFRVYCSNIKIVKFKRNPKLVISMLELIEYVPELALIFNSSKLVL